MEVTYIYGLVDPDCREVRYIGKADEPPKRLVVHMQDARHTMKCIKKGGIQVCIPSPKEYWLMQLIREGKRPYIVILERCSYDVWREREAAWIDFFLESGIYLTNRDTIRGKGKLNEDWYTYLGRMRYICMQHKTPWPPIGY